MAVTAVSAAVTLLVGAVILALLGASPLTAYALITAGAAGSADRLAYAMTAWAPILLCCAGLLLTFAAGLWNIGIEGQIVIGAVSATGALRLLGDAAPGAPAVVAAAVAGGAGGALWALLAGALRTYGGVSEIFGGLGLNFIAGSLTVYLVLGPWARAGIASTSGTVPFPDTLWLPTLPMRGLVVPFEVVVALAALGAVSAALRGTRFGLRLRAIGRSATAAHLRGVPVAYETLRAFAACGALAGLAGFALVGGAYSRHQLFPLVSGGYGFLAILVMLLAGRSGGAALLISAFFAAISTGSLQLPLQMQLDSSMGGILEGTLVLAVLLLRGVQSRLTASR